ncbi:MAG: hypothetical protein WBV89_18860, partial [Ilumatobacter sp.]
MVLDIDDGFHRMDATHPEFLLYQERIAALQSVITRSAEIWCSTESLADSVTATEALIRVIPNSIDPRLWRRYRPLQQPPERAGDHGLEILYAGTATHGSDFDSIVPALDELAQQTQFRLTVIGVAPQVVDRPWLRRMTPGQGGLYPKYATWMRDAS